MGYTNIKADRQHDADQRRIRELEAQLQRERNQPKQPHQHPQASNGGGHVTIEKTSKPLKARMLIGWALLAFGIAVLGYFGSPIGGFAALAGLVLLIVTKIQIWWRHG